MPWPLRLYILVGGMLPIAWTLVTIGTFAVAAGWIIPEGAPRSGPAYDQRADGVIKRVEKTGTEILNKPVIAVVATYTDDQGIGREVRSYESTTSLRTVDSRVTVRYQREHPERAVIEGMRTHVTPWWLAPLLYVFFAGFAVAPALWGLGKRRRALVLLRHGEHAVGTIVDVRSRGTGEDREQIATIELARRDGQKRTIEARSAKDGFFVVGHVEALVYDPASPQHATLLRQLPGKPVIDGNERVRFG